MPGLSITVDNMIVALRGISDDEVANRIYIEPNATIERSLGRGLAHLPMSMQRVSDFVLTLNSPMLFADNSGMNPVPMFIPYGFPAYKGTNRPRVRAHVTYR